MLSEAFSLFATSALIVTTVVIRSNGEVFVSVESPTSSNTGGWLANSLFFTPAQVNSQYRVISISMFYGNLVSAPPLPATLNNDVVFVVEGIASFQINIVPTTNNPRYGEAGYVSYIRVDTNSGLPF
jgi:hypothetical protein